MRHGASRLVTDLKMWLPTTTSKFDIEITGEKYSVFLNTLALKPLMTA
jgi:hypothetical protein